ncbi:Pyridoxal phosphate-dependent transferase [Phytophthora cactorum]|nr:Pyridoxal phosphate-dependent transferase [Phytophthora cactorum]
MVGTNQELETTTGSVLKKPVTIATSTRTQKPLRKHSDEEEEKSPEYSTGSSSLALDASFGIEAADVDQVLRDMADNMIGRNVPFQSPFGTKAQVYADYTAIHPRPRHAYLRQHAHHHVRHGLQTTSFREEARQVIVRAVNARENKDVVIFAGQGCTSAINKLVTALGVNKGRRRHRAYKRPVIFTCPFSHHSNLLPWRESPCADENRPLKIGSFAAASNLTGMLIDVDKVSTLLHKYGALACWDYATCAPYVDINMNPKDDPLAYKDAVFFSGHKFVGGPGSPGVLVVKKNLMNNEVPTVPGGGTVLFVTEKAHSYLANKVEREEEALRTFWAVSVSVWPSSLSNTWVLNVSWISNVSTSSTSANRSLPIFSMMIRFGDRFLHHNFVCALLNDVFGVQARGGCQCAGPFGSRLLGLSRDHIVDLGHAVVAKHEILKPGVAREVNYVLEAVHFVADHGWKFLPQYDFNCRTGVWRHVSRAGIAFPDKKRLSDMQIEDVETVRSSIVVDPFETWLLTGDRTSNRQSSLQTCRSKAASSDFQQSEKVADTHEGLRWFAYPSEAVAVFQDMGVNPPLSDEISGPCQPQRYFDPAINHVWDGVPTLATMKRHRVVMAARMLIARCMPGQGSPLLMDMTPVTDSEDESGSEAEDSPKHL